MNASRPKRNIPAVAQLVGITLDSGWKIIKLLELPDHQTGGCFSIAYVVEKDGQEAFLKAFDFSRAFEVKNSMDVLKDLTNAYVYERDLLQFCKEKRLRKVVVALDYGEQQVPGYEGAAGRIYYLVFDLADGDIRRQVRVDQRFDAVWSLGALHDVATGLFQIHRQMIAHQDVKPSNVLVFGEECRIGDLGRASRKGRAAVHDGATIAGDPTYAPPEQLYGFTDQDFTVRRIGCDLYMLGNLAAFMLTGINITAAILNSLDKQQHPTNWFGARYADVLPYVLAAFATVMRDVRSAIDPIAGEEIATMIGDLCNPDLARRGNPKRIGKADQYSLERTISRLDFVKKQAAIRARSAKRSA